MSNRICNSKSEPYWCERDWHPTHMTFAWLDAELRVYAGGGTYSWLPKAVRQARNKRRKAAKLSRRANRWIQRRGR